MRYIVATIPGDGIGPDVVREAVTALDAAGKVFGFGFEYREAPMGGCAIDAFGSPLPAASLATCKKSDAVLLGAVGGPTWDKLPGAQRPEAGLLGLRAGLGAYANLRPARLFPGLEGASPLKASVIGTGLDLLVVRELTGGIYFGDRGRSPDGESAWDTERYSKPEITRLLRVAFDAARGRKKRLCVVDKANVLESSRLWRETAKDMASQWPDVELSFLYVDAAAMELVRAPGRFDVIATSNMFGDILSDEAAMITGSIGMLASASMGERRPDGGAGPGIFEPIHGSAPDIAGQDRANPLATILSASMLLSYSLGESKAATAVEAAVTRVLAGGYRCADIGSGDPAEKIVGTREMGRLVTEAILEAGR